MMLLIDCQCVKDFRISVLGFYVSLKETFSNETTFTVINKSCKGAVIQIATVFQPIWRVLSKDPLKHGFLVIYLTIFLGAGISRNTSATRVIFCWQMLKI